MKTQLHLKNKNKKNINNKKRYGLHPNNNKNMACTQ